MSEETRECTECKETKAISEFYKHKEGKDGYLVKCKKCVLKYQKEWKKTKGKEKMAKKYKKEVEFTAAQQEVIKMMKDPRSRDSRKHFTIGEKGEKELCNFISFLKKNDYTEIEISKLLHISVSVVGRYSTDKAKKVITSTEVSNHKDSLHRVNVLTSKREPLHSTFTVDLANNALLFASTSDLFNFMKKSAGEE